MEAIVLAGGFGTRLRQVIADVPKPMAPIGGRPFLEILLGTLAGKGFRRVILSLGFMADKISGHFGEQFAGVELNYVVEDQPLGTGGAIRGLGLTAFGLDKASFVATSAAIDLGVDSSRLAVYWMESSLPAHFWKELPFMMLVSVLGTFTGRSLLHRVSQDQFRQIILFLILGAGLWSLYVFFFGNK